MIWRERPVGLALVGCGQMGRVHAAAIAREKRASLVAVQDADTSRATEFAQEFRGARAVPALEDVLADPRVDGVMLATPHHLHFSQVMLALGAGKHVFVEKPMALSVDDARTMCERAAAVGRRLLVGQVMRFWPNVARAAQDIKAGAIGDVRHVSRRRLVYQRDAGRAWAHDPSQAGGWLLHGNAVHEIDAMLFMCGGRVTEAFAVGARTNPAWQDFDELSAVLRLEGGAVASLVQTLNAHTVGLDTMITGTAGSISLNEMHRGYALNGERIPLGDDSGIGAQLRDLVNVIRNDVASRIDAHHVLPTMVALDLLRESLERGVPQTADDVERLSEKVTA
jgi:predicted dehydrogenase